MSTHISRTDSAPPRTSSWLHGLAVGLTALAPPCAEAAKGV